MLPYQPVICHYEQQWRMFDDGMWVSIKFLCYLFYFKYSYCKTSVLLQNLVTSSLKVNFRDQTFFLVKQCEPQQKDETT